MSAAGAKLVKQSKISVLLPPDEADRFGAYCLERGYKKSTLIARLIREHLDSEQFRLQGALFKERGPRKDTG